MYLPCVFALFILLHRQLPTTSKAEILIDNLNRSVSCTPAVNGPLGATESRTAIQFTTGTGTWQFIGLTARFREDSSLTPDGMRIEVRTETATPPGTVAVSTLTSATDVVGEADYSFSPTVPFTLDGQMNYCLVAKTTNMNSLYGWFLTTFSADNGKSNWSLTVDYRGIASSGLFRSGPLPAVPILSNNATQTSAVVPEHSLLTLIGSRSLDSHFAATQATHPKKA